MKHLVHTGKSTGKGCLTAGKIFFGIVGITACITYFIFRDPSDFGFETLLIIGIAGSLVYEFFRPKAKSIELSMKIDKNFLYLVEEKIPFGTLHLHLYADGKRLRRYHLWDDHGLIAIYSIHKDALVRNLNELGVLTEQFKEISSSNSGSGGVSVFCENKRKLYYSLETGEFWINEPEKDEINIMPKYVIVDPKYVDSEQAQAKK